MDEKYTELAVHLASVDSRCEANEHKITEHEQTLKELREKQDAIYDLTSSVKSIATDMAYIKEDVKEVKSGQDRLNEKVTVLENRPASDTKKRWDNIFNKLLWLIAGGIAIGILSAIFPYIPW